ncbi:MAG TPA: hypothetical protein VK968_03280, partial [Roseimicrobium sp.]|nr:hypothetical protein [Roseimicrobium sp.]
SLALPDRADEVTYAPWDTDSQRRRIRQQIGSAPNYFRPGAVTVSGLSSVRQEGFDPSQNLTTTPLSRVIAAGQLAMLTSAGGTVTQPDFVKDRYHDFTGAAYSVLANTLPSSNANRGLLLDLSTKPSLLGTAYEKYADYASYMEAPGTVGAGVPISLLIPNADSSRRRYVTQAFTDNAAAGLPDIAFSVAPVLSNFIIQFQARRVSASNPALQIRSRVYASMWNPYGTALVPPSNLKLVVTGLPTIQVQDATVPGTVVNVDLQATHPFLAAGAITLDLPFSAADRYSGSSSFGADGELSTWLPGRVYSWVTASGASAGSTLGFYSNSVGATGWTHTVAGTPTGSGLPLHVEIPDVDGTPLTVTVMLGSNIVATYTARYDADTVPNSNIGTTSADYWCFGFTFRLNQPRDYDLDRSWITRFDPRATSFNQVASDNTEVLIPFNTRLTTSGLPSKYINTLATTDSTGSSNLNGNLFYRVQGSNARAMSTYNDVSLFDLPRLPL